MKRIFILIATILLLTSLTGCTSTDKTIDRDTDVDIISTEPDDKAEATDLSQENTDITNTQADFINITGIITEINNDMITLSEVNGLDTSNIVTIIVSENTKYSSILAKDMIDLNKYINVNISKKMTRSMPPQTQALQVNSVNDVILGKVLTKDGNTMSIEPISDYFNNDEVIIHIGDDTIQTVSYDSILEGNHIRVAVSNNMTMSIPPQVSAVQLLSIETHD